MYVGHQCDLFSLNVTKYFTCKWPSYTGKNRGMHSLAGVVQPRFGFAPSHTQKKCHTLPRQSKVAVRTWRKSTCPCVCIPPFHFKFQPLAGYGQTANHCDPG